MKKLLTLILAAILLINMSIMTSAEESRERCEMTIDANVHDWNNKVTAPSPCNNVSGYYDDFGGNFTIIGSVTMTVEKNGQEFEVSHPKHNP
ncbi:hypothetical protein ACTWQB_17140, partial [Piscibacillus sp. B03]|uniref:hypothetical protein n=1 Tax=Piscibacillus sp. B03 TaxID=3457430 RepID=UPI003FCCA4D9